MSDLSDSELVNLLVKKQDTGALNELLERHSGIFIDTASKYFPQNNVSEFRDFLELKEYYIWDAARTFQEEKSQFHTWLSNRTRYACLTERSKKEKEKLFVPKIEDQEIEEEMSPDDYLSCRELMEDVKDFLINKTNERDYEIFYQRHINGEKLTNIAKQYGISTQRAQQINSHVEKQLEGFK